MRPLTDDTLMPPSLKWPIAVYAMGVLPVLYIRFRRTRRMREFVIQLPFALDLIKSSIEAGHSLLRGLQVPVQGLRQQHIDEIGLDRPYRR